MLNNYVNVEISIMKKLLDLVHEKLANILGGTNIHACQPSLEMSIHVLKSARGQLLCMWLHGFQVFKGKWTFMDSFPIYFTVDLNFKGRVCDKKDYLERDEARLPLPENHVAT